MTDVLAERARIEEQVAGRTLVDALADTVRTYPDEPAYSDKHHVPEGETWRTLTWTETRELALDVAAGLRRARRRRRRHGRDHGDQPDRALPRRHGRGARRGDADVDLQHALPGAGRLRRRARRADGRRPRERRPPRPLGAGARRVASVRKVVVLDADARARGRPVRRPGTTSWPRARRTAPTHADEVEQPGPASSTPTTRRRSSTRPARPGTRRAWCSPTTTCSTRRSARSRRPGSQGVQTAGQLPAAGAHRRAGARALRPADRGQPHARDRRPRRAAGRARRGAPDRLLRGARGSGRRSRPASRPSSPPTRTPTTSSWSRTRWRPGWPGSRPRRSAAR